MAAATIVYGLPGTDDVGEQSVRESEEYATRRPFGGLRSVDGPTGTRQVEMVAVERAQANAG
jgi:hypothetical protein